MVDMKKILIFLLVMIFPVFVFAQDIKEITIDGSSKISTNKETSLTFKINFTGLGEEDGYGIGGYSYQLDFDDNVLVPISVKKNDFFNTNIYKDEKGKYYVVGTINKNNKSTNRCNDNVLYCSNISDTITFGVKNTKLSKTTIKLFSSSIYLYKVGSELTDTDRLIIDSIKDINKSLTISKSSSKSVNTNNISTSIQSKNLERMIESKVQNYKVETDSKSNNYLSNLEIEGYTISFDKHLLSYDLEVPYDVNSLTINATSENENATVSIIGNDNLEENNYLVIVKVIAEDKSEKEYKINIQKEEKVEEEQQELETTEDIKKYVETVKKKIDDKTIKTIKIVGVCLLGIIVFVIIVKLITNRKLDKKIENFDDF